jgi:fumarylacetoacetate (FAA) hydrolase
MKLASRRDGRDGSLLVVSRDLSSALCAARVAPTLQAALDDWEQVEPGLQALYDALNAGRTTHSFRLEEAVLDAPLPRAWQWLDASVFPQHGALMAKAFGRAPIESEFPLMYQGMSHRFLGPRDAVELPAEEDGIDFEGEFAVITGEVPMGADRRRAGASIRLVMQVNDWSLRRLAAVEVRSGFGFILAKPACSAAPIVVSPGELGPAWREYRVQAMLEVHRGEALFGRVPADEMSLGFDELIAHAVRTRALCAGTIIGSGTVSSSRYAETGSCCISERQAIEMIVQGKPETPFLHHGERVRMAAFAAGSAIPLFGTLDNVVARAAVAVTQGE